MQHDNHPASYPPTDFGAQRRALLAGLGGLAAGAALARPASAGTLTPPGAPAGTMKRLDVVEPRIPIGLDTTPGSATSLYRISQPGAYYLKENLLGRSPLRGIEITASHVTIDLMGFLLDGRELGTTGVFAEPGLQGIRVFNGTVRGWLNSGLNMTLTSVGEIARVLAVGNTQNGIVGGGRYIVTDCAAEANTSTGIFCSNGSVVARCAVESNGGSGILVGSGSAVHDCISRENASNGIHGSGQSAISGCSAFLNSGDGIHALSSCVITNCTAAQNLGNGLRVAHSSLVQNNTSALNGLGTEVAAGIRVVGANNRIEGNNLVGNGLGMDVDSSGNFIVRNAASGNSTNYDIVANNMVGVIFNAPNSVAINGSTGGAGVGTTDPWANFSY